jgi:hypothetical protein
MEKKIFVATGLSILVLLAYSVILPKPKTVGRHNVTEISMNDAEEPSENVSDKAIPADPLPSPATPVDDILSNILEEKELYRLSTDKLTFVFSTKGAFIAQVIDKYNDKKLSFTNLGRVPSWSSFDFSASEILRGVVFEYKSPDAGLTIKKIFTVKSDHSLDLVISISNVTNSISNDYDICVGEFEISKDPAVAQ